MSMIVNHDVVSLMGQRIMQKNSLAIRRSLEKLSTGLRTKIADVDNTAGLAISETMRSRIGGMEKALNNTQDGISMIQTASGALDQTQGMLRRMRELTVQAANDVLTQQDRSYIQTEINEIRDGITRLAETTQFNRKRILSGDNAVLWSSTDKNARAIIEHIEPVDADCNFARLFTSSFVLDGLQGIDHGLEQRDKGIVLRQGEVANPAGEVHRIQFHCCITHVAPPVLLKSTVNGILLSRHNLIL